jgi:hypothetical protein
MNNSDLNNQRRVYLTVVIIWLILLITLMSSIVAFDLQRARTHFFEKANQLYQQANGRVHIVESILEGFAAMISVTSDFNRERIRSYAQKMHQQYPFIYMFEIVEKVSRDKIDSFVEYYRRNFYPDFEVKGFSYETDRQWQPISEKSFYLPIVFMEPFPKESQKVLGLDISVVYGRRALPLGWLVVKGGKGHLAEESHMALVEQVAELVPPGATIIFLGDGAAWVWEIARTCFPQAVLILDYYHASQHVDALARAIYEEEDAAQNWSLRWRSLIYDSELDVLLSEARAAAAPTLTEAAQRELGYLERNRARMDYRHYREQGWFIGSGVVEAGCKRVIGQRLKQSGMFWRESGASAVASLRCALLSAGGWDDLWSRPLVRAA